MRTFLVVERCDADRSEVVHALAHPGERTDQLADLDRVLPPGNGTSVLFETRDRCVRVAVHEIDPERRQLGVVTPVLDDGSEHRRMPVPHTRAVGDADAQRCGGVLVCVACQPRLGGVVTLSHGAPRKFGQHGVLALEVEVEAGAAAPSMP